MTSSWCRHAVITAIVYPWERKMGDRTIFFSRKAPQVGKYYDAVKLAVRATRRARRRTAVLSWGCKRGNGRDRRGRERRQGKRKGGREGRRDIYENSCSPTAVDHAHLHAGVLLCASSGTRRVGMWMLRLWKRARNSYVGPMTHSEYIPVHSVRRYTSRTEGSKRSKREGLVAAITYVQDRDASDDNLSDVLLTRNG